MPVAVDMESGGTAIGAAAAYFSYVAVIKAVTGGGTDETPPEAEKTELMLIKQRRAAAGRGLGYSDSQHEPMRAPSVRMAAYADDPDATRSSDEPVGPPTKIQGPIEYGRALSDDVEPYPYNKW